jgi:hypothetical protein
VSFGEVTTTMLFGTASDVVVEVETKVLVLMLPVTEVLITTG